MPEYYRLDTYWGRVQPWKPAGTPVTIHWMVEDDGETGCGVERPLGRTGAVYMSPNPTLVTCKRCGHMEPCNPNQEAK